MNERTFEITDTLDKAVIAHLMLRTRLTMGPKNPLIPIVLNSLYEAIDYIQQNFEPDMFSDSEYEWINEAAQEIMDMSEDPEYSHLFTLDGEPDDEL